MTAVKANMLYNAYQCGVSAEKVLDSANSMITKGFKKAGYSYVIVDDCWSIQSGRNNITHEIIPDPTKFPIGIDGLADKLHQISLKSGIYSSAGLEPVPDIPAL